MIVLGRKHQFSQMELEQLKKRFKEIHIVRYRGRAAGEVIGEIEGIFSRVGEGEIEYLVLNTLSQVDEAVIRYLTNLCVRCGHRLKMVGIEEAMERFLHKCYIPNDRTDLRFLGDIKGLGWGGYLIKRGIDILGAVILGLLVWPVMIYAAWRIGRESPGPVIFRQMRVGLGGREFECIKFRSMRLDAEKSGSQFASKDDERIFKFGRFMRQTRIDELPQLLNVLKGEMHLIGPRPERLVWTEDFERVIPYYNERHIIRPGITGWAQVCYPYGSGVEDAREKLMYDLYYIKHWSVWLEIKVILKTIFVVLGREGI